MHVTADSYQSQENSFLDNHIDSTILRPPKIRWQALNKISNASLMSHWQSQARRIISLHHNQLTSDYEIGNKLIRNSVQDTQYEILQSQSSQYSSGKHSGTRNNVTCVWHKPL